MGKKFVDEMGGEIQVKYKLGEVSQFKIYLWNKELKRFESKKNISIVVLTAP